MLFIKHFTRPVAEELSYEFYLNYLDLQCCKRSLRFNFKLIENYSF